MGEKTHGGSGKKNRRTFLKLASACGLATSGMTGAASAKQGARRKPEGGKKSPWRSTTTTRKTGNLLRLVETPRMTLNLVTGLGLSAP